jgi:predicted nucleotidyltransferase
LRESYKWEVIDLCSRQELNTILSEFLTSAKTIFSEHLVSLVLFGSYARGDYDNESDIDVLVLVDLDKMKIKDYRNELVHHTSELELEYNLVISPIIMNASEFEQYKNASGFLKNVQQEGVLISA